MIGCDSEGTIVYWSPAARQVYGYSASSGEILGVTESRVCQILRKLRQKLDAHEQLFVAAAAA